ncbi:MAG TPA: signal recognition particle-docking protein FtsY [Candidatus Cloacimonetes bacterium]|nr:signal recognition particle-docking protein FtsY [Candidatus Cloacimonadota bacterium]
MSVVSGLKKKLAKTHNSFFRRLAELLRISGKVDEELIEDIEDLLVQADIGLTLTTKIVGELEEYIRINKLNNPEEIYAVLENIIIHILSDEYKNEKSLDFNPKQRPYVLLFVGVNGVGKTTTIAKCALRFKKEGNKVLLVAGDTFRAAAIEQLELWAKRISVEMIGQEYGSDPSSVIFNAMQSAKAQDYDVVLIDTAGRLHTKINLMRELEKIKRTIQKHVPDAPHQTLLVIDATTGQNGVQQAKKFLESIHIDGVILTKLDGTAKGGVALGIKDSLSIPIKAIGVGEQMDDLRDFNSEDFVKAIFE